MQDIKFYDVAPSTRSSTRGSGQENHKIKELVDTYNHYCKPEYRPNKNNTNILIHELIEALEHNSSINIYFSLRTISARIKNIIDFRKIRNYIEKLRKEEKITNLEIQKILNFIIMNVALNNKKEEIAKEAFFYSKENGYINSFICKNYARSLIDRDMYQNAFEILLVAIASGQLDINSSNHLFMTLIEKALTMGMCGSIIENIFQSIIDGKIIIDQELCCAAVKAAKKIGNSELAFSFFKWGIEHAQLPSRIYTFLVRENKNPYQIKEIFELAEKHNSLTLKLLNASADALVGTSGDPSRAFNFCTHYHEQLMKFIPILKNGSYDLRKLSFATAYYVAWQMLHENKNSLFRVPTEGSEVGSVVAYGVSIAYQTLGIPYQKKEQKNNPESGYTSPSYRS